MKLLLAEEELEESRRQKPPGGNALEDLIVVGHDQQHSRRFSSDLGDERVAGIEQGLELLGHVHELLARHGHESPVVLPGRVVDVEPRGYFGIEVTKVEASEHHLAALQSALGVLLVTRREA